jgi:hypothetical protein
MGMSKKVKRLLGDVLIIPLGDGTFGAGRVLKSPLVAFYDYRGNDIPDIYKIIKQKVIFKLWVMNYAITDGDWTVVGNLPLEPELTKEPLFYKRDSITKALSIYRNSTGEQYLAKLEDCAGLECAAVWEPEHVVDRLNDYFAGRPNKWVESLRPLRP